VRESVEQFVDRKRRIPQTGALVAYGSTHSAWIEIKEMGDKLVRGAAR
jgi:hypothetical protein